MNPLPGKAQQRGPWLEVGLLVLLCYFHAGAPPPSSNEAHYLGKAKHYWDSTWCRHDFFLESADAHEVFYWTFGWVAHVASLPTAAWVGRLVAWTCFAWAWRTLVYRATSASYAPLLSAVLLFWFVQSWNLAGEWLVGGIEAKGFAYPLVFLAMASLIQRRWWIVWPLLGMASSFHILVGGWAVIACLCAWLIRRREDQLSWGELLVWLMLGGLFALPGLVPALQLTSRASPAELQEASRIYTFRRLAHHLVFQRFSWWCIVRFATLTLAWWYAATRLVAPSDRMRRLNAVVLGSLVIAFLGMAIDFVTGPFLDLRASILRYYWFRLSDILVPVGLAISLVSTLLDSPAARSRRAIVWHVPLAVTLTLATLSVVWSSGRSGCFARPLALQQQSWGAWFGEDFGPRYIDQQWREACAWIRDYVPEDVVFLTPVRQQTFKWYAERPDVVTWKDVPQDAHGLLDWWQRRQEIYALPAQRPWEDTTEFMNLVDKYRVTHVVWPNSKDDPQRPAPGRLLFRNILFSVYQL